VSEMQTRHWVGLLGLGLCIRLVYVGWAPHVPWADGRFYHLYAVSMSHGSPYINVDGSPAIRWMPGWPVLLAGLYRLFGASASVGMWANAVFDSIAVGFLAHLGTRLFNARCGLIAAGLFAIWPGLVFYSATLYTEPVFNLLFTGTLLTLVIASEAEQRQTGWFLAAGAGFGACILVKPDPVPLFAVVFLFMWMRRRTASGFAKHAIALAIAAAAMLTPWTIRNYIVFDRFIPLSASGGISAHLVFYPGATGGQNHVANSALNRFYRGTDNSQTSLARMDAGWNDAVDFIRANPGESAMIVLNKFSITYRGDSQAVLTTRGAGPEPEWNISRASWERLSALADVFWFAMLGLAAFGATRLGGWPAASGVLTLGLLAAWYGLHVLFLGGQRYHVPEAIAYSLLAAVAIDWFAGRFARAKA
jgi:4-amino-4-deoxy-L-arabinose transferase-like glycosyltransferase